MRPISLRPNLIRRPYLAAGMLAEFRGVAGSIRGDPEDWVGSTTTAYGAGSDGLTVLEDGRALREMILAEPESYLGSQHVAHYGSDPALLVKLLDAGERLAVHCHPNREFARLNLACHFGKTEAWIVVSTETRAAEVYVGFRDECLPDTLRTWVRDQRTDALLTALNRIPVHAGDTVLVPAGVPHAVGGGIFLVELQEPTDFSVFLEQPSGGPLAGDHLGLPLDTALACVDRTGWNGTALSGLLSSRGQIRPGVEQLFSADADPFFRAERLRPAPAVSLEAAFSVLVIIRGSGSLDVANERLLVRRGDTIMIPFDASPAILRGSLDAICCMPPAADI
jgi:mannose-6-phosphate isomerase